MYVTETDKLGVFSFVHSLPCLFIPRILWLTKHFPAPHHTSIIYERSHPIPFPFHFMNSKSTDTLCIAEWTFSYPGQQMTLSYPSQSIQHCSLWSPNWNITKTDSGLCLSFCVWAECETLSYPWVHQLAIYSPLLISQPQQSPINCPGELFLTPRVFCFSRYVCLNHCLTLSDTCVYVAQFRYAS